MSRISTRICVPNLVAVRRSCRKGGGGYRQTDRQRETAALYSRIRSPCVCSVIQNQQRRIDLMLSCFILVLDAVHRTGNMSNIYIMFYIYII